MTRPRQAAAACLRDRRTVLALAVALVLAAAPPPRLPEAPAPGPLVPPDEVPVNALGLSVVAFGAVSQPAMGPVSILATVYAGEQHRAWNLEGPLTNRFHRISLGATTLVLGGTGRL